MIGARDHHDPRYRRVFPQNPSDVVKRGHGEEKDRFVCSALAAIAAENEAKARLRVTFEQACDHLDEAEPRLTLLYPKQPALVKSFFYTKPKGE